MTGLAFTGRRLMRPERFGRRKLAKLEPTAMHPTPSLHSPVVRSRPPRPAQRRAPLTTRSSSASPGVVSNPIPGSKASKEDAGGDEPLPGGGGRLLSMDAKDRATLGQVWQLARAERGLIGVGMALLTGTTAISLAVPHALGTLVDAAFKFETSTPYGVAAALLGLFAAQAVMLVGRSAALTLAGERIAARLRKAVLFAILSQDTGFFDRHSTGELTNRLAADVLCVQDAVSWYVAQALRNLFLVVGSGGMLFGMSPGLAAACLIVFPPTVLAGRYFGRRLRDQQKEVQSALADANAVAEEAIAGLRTVRLFDAERREHDRYSDKIGIAYGRAATLAVTNAFYTGTMSLGSHITIVTVMAVGGQQVMTGALSPGQLTAFLMYSVYMVDEFMTLMENYAEIMRAMGASERVMQILRSVPNREEADERRRKATEAYDTVEGLMGSAASSAVAAPRHGVLAVGSPTATVLAAEVVQHTRIETVTGRQLKHVKGHVAFEDVRFSYPTRPEAHVLRGMTLRVLPKQTLAIVGASGCGKSTVCKLLSRLYDPQGGVIRLDGTPLSELDPHWLRRSVMSIVEQEPILFGGTIADNIRYGKPDATDVEVVAAAKVANAHSFIANLPLGYGTGVGEHGGQLSGGQKQRIAIARAVVKDPPVLLLDEATSALDSESEYLVQMALEQVTRGRTSIIVAHRLSTVRRMADVIAVVHGGRVVETGSFKELMANPTGEFRHMVEYQGGA